MSNQKRIYIVTDKAAKVDFLIKATSQAQAVRHVARMQFDVSVASAVDVADKLTAGVKLEDAGEPKPDLFPDKE